MGRLSKKRYDEELRGEIERGRGREETDGH